MLGGKLCVNTSYSVQSDKASKKVKGDALELYVGALLEEFERNRDIVREYHVLVSRHYPDYWV